MFKVFFIRLFSIFLTPFLIIYCIPIYIIRNFILLLSKIFRRDFSRILESQSTIYALQGVYSNPKTVILVTLIIEGGTSEERCIRRVEEVLSEKLNGKLRYGRLQEYLTPWMGFYFWTKKKDFKVTDHCKIIYKWNDDQVQVVEDVQRHEYCKEISHKELKEIEIDLLKRSFCPGRSPWEFCLIKNVKPKFAKQGVNYDAVIFKMHHSLGDGFTLLKMWGLMDDFKINICNKNEGEKSTGNDALEKAQDSRKSGNKLRIKEILLNFYISILTPFEFVYQMLSLKPDENDFHLEKNELHGMGNFRLVESDRIPLEAIKEIKRHFGVQFISVVLAAVTGGIRKSMEKKGLEIPSFVTCGVPVPIPGHPDKMTNHMSVVNMKFPVGMVDFEERLKCLNKQLEDFKRDVGPMITFKIQYLTGSFFYWMIKPLASIIHPTALLSDFPGPTGEIWKFGSRISDLYFTLSFPKGRVGLMFTSFSYNGHWKMNLAVDHGILDTDEEVQDFMDGIVAELATFSEESCV